MANTTLLVDTVDSATGWTNATVAALTSTQGTDYASDGTAGEFIEGQLTNTPADFGDLVTSGHYESVIARRVGATSRDKFVTFEILDSADNVLVTGTTLALSTLFSQTQRSFTNNNYTKSDIDGWKYRLTVTEGGGMPDSATVDIDYYLVFLQYNVGANVITKLLTSNIDNNIDEKLVIKYFGRASTDENTLISDENNFSRFAIRQNDDDIVLINDEGVQLETTRNVTVTQNLASITDETIKKVFRIRDALDSINVYDDYAFTVERDVVIYTKTGTSVIDVTDQILTARVLNRSVVDSHTVTDQSLASTLRQLLLTDSAALADTLLASASRVRKSDDSALINDEVRSFNALNRANQSNLLTEDQILSQSFRTSSSQDTITASDFVSLTANRNRAATSNLSSTDELLRSLSNARLLSDAVSLLDESSLYRVIGRLSSEVLSLNDALLRYAIRNRTADDALTLIDSFLFEVIQSGQFYFKTSDDSFSLFDENLREIFSVRLQDDQITLVDSASVFASRFSSSDDIILLIDAIASTAQRNRQATSTINVQDVFSTAAIRQKLQDDLIGVTDQALAIRLVNRALQDVIENVIDQFSFSITGVVLSETIDDSVSIKDESSFYISANRAVTNNILAIDQILSHTKYERLSQDLTSITDKLDKRLDFYRAKSEDISVFDSATWIINRIKILSDSFYVDDEQLSFRIRGRDALETLNITDQNIYKIIGDLRFGVRIRIGTALDIAAVSVDAVAVLTAISDAADISIDNFVMLGTNNPNINLGAYN